MINKKMRAILVALLTCTTLASLSNTEVLAKERDVKTMYVSTPRGLNVRTWRTKNSKKIGALPFNREVCVIENYGDWSLIEYKDERAYVCNKYLSDEKTYVEYVDKTSNGTYLGTFTASYYCACSACCGVSTGITASGTVATAGRTVAVDPGRIPLGTRLLINGQEYVAEDTGGGVNGNWIDIFCSSHQEALNRGLASVEVYILN